MAYSPENQTYSPKAFLERSRNPLRGEVYYDQEGKLYGFLVKTQTFELNGAKILYLGGYDLLRKKEKAYLARLYFVDDKGYLRYYLPQREMKEVLVPLLSFLESEEPLRLGWIAAYHIQGKMIPKTLIEKSFDPEILKRLDFEGVFDFSARLRTYLVCHKEKYGEDFDPEKGFSLPKLQPTTDREKEEPPHDA